MDSFKTIDNFSFLNNVIPEQDDFMRHFTDDAPPLNNNYMYAQAPHQQVQQNHQPHNQQQQTKVKNEFEYNLDMFAFQQMPNQSYIQAPQQVKNEVAPNSPFSSESQSAFHRTETHSEAHDKITYCTKDDRGWKLVHVNPMLINPSQDYNEQISAIAKGIKTEIRTRSDKPSLVAPERMYSSLKYEIRQSVAAHCCINGKPSVLMSKIQIVNPLNYKEEILKQNGQKLIKGMSEMTAMSATNNIAMECKLKIQFQSVSFHHERKYFAFCISFYDPSYKIDEPILVILSDSFQVFARRPSSSKPAQKKTSLTGKKRKSSESTENEEENEEGAEQPQSPSKKKKVEGSSSSSEKPLPKTSYSDFMRCLDLLLMLGSNLNPQDKVAAFQAAIKKVEQEEGNNNSPSQSQNQQPNRANQHPTISSSVDIESLFTDF